MNDLRKFIISKRFTSIILDILNWNEHHSNKYSDFELFKVILKYINMNMEEMKLHVGTLLLTCDSAISYQCGLNDVNDNFDEYKNNLVSLIDELITKIPQYKELWAEKDKYFMLM